MPQCCVSFQVPGRSFQDTKQKAPHTSRRRPPALRDGAPDGLARLTPGAGMEGGAERMQVLEHGPWSQGAWVGGRNSESLNSSGTLIFPFPASLAPKTRNEA